MPPVLTRAERQQRRNNRSREIQRLGGKRPQTRREQDDQIVQRGGRVRADAGWEIFKVMLPDDQTGMLRDQPRPAHTRIAIGIDKIDFPLHENIGVIRTACAEDEPRKKSELEDVPEPAPGATEQIGIRKSQIENLIGPTRIRTWDQGIMSPLL